MSFSDQKTAARMRDSIERIVVGVLRRERPEPRIGKVYSFDPNTMTAQVMFTGDKPSEATKVNVAENMIPKVFLEDYYDAQGVGGPGDVVRVAGKPGNYYILGFVFGTPEGLPAAGSEPVITFGTSGQFWDGTKTFRAITVADVAGAAVDSNMVHRTSDETINGVKTFQKPVALTEQGVIPSLISGVGQIYAKSTDKLPYWLGSDGIERPIIVPTVSFLQNSDFEANWIATSRAGSPASTTQPANWTDFWSNNVIGYFQDSTTKASGIYSVRVERPASPGGTNLQYTTPIAVQPYDTIKFSAWAKGSLASGQRIHFTIISAATSAGANFFASDPTTLLQEVITPISSTWNKYESSFTIPAGHLFMRMSIAFTLSIAETTTTYWIDNVGTSLEHSSSGSIGTWAKESVVAVATGNVTLSGSGSAPSIDGVSVQEGQRLLLVAQTTASQNGIYTVHTSSGVAWTRTEDADTATDLAGAVVSVLGGTNHGGSKWTNNFRTSDTLGTTAMPWYKIDEGVPQPIIRRRLATSTSAGTAAAPIPYDTAVDTAVGITWDAANNRFTIPKTGRYLISASSGVVPQPSGTGQYVSIYAEVNGTERIRHWQYSGASNGNVAWPRIGDAIQLTAGDLVRIMAHANGTSYVVEGFSDLRSSVSITYLGT